MFYMMRLMSYSIMKPNTPHAVFTIEHSIALGGHFYTFANLQDTIAIIFHCFALDNIITNTEHPETRILLFRMMEYVHKFYVEGADPQSAPSLFMSPLQLILY